MKKVYIHIYTDRSSSGLLKYVVFSSPFIHPSFIHLLSYVVIDIPTMC